MGAHAWQASGDCMHPSKAARKIALWAVLVRADREIKHIFSTAVLELGENIAGVGISEGTAVIQRVEGHSFSFLWAVAASAGKRWAAGWPLV